MAERELHWWRIAVDPEGKVTSCERVERSESDSSAVYYVRAVDRAAAEREAANRYFAASNRRRRARYEAEGKCRCGRARDNAGFRYCAECRALHRDYQARTAARKQGEEVPELDRVEQVQKRKAAEADQTRLAVLQEVEQAWVSSSTNKAFTTWLRSQIEAITGRRVA